MGDAIQIAIDGPSGAGKSTIAKSLGKILNIDYIDTGAMYRAVAYKILKEGIDLEDEEALNAMLENIDIDLRSDETFLDGENISGLIRTQEVSKAASDASALPLIRERLVALQQAMGSSKDVILDGRDIGTNVFPGAQYKFFLTASLKERAKRRWVDLRNQGKTVELASVEEDIALRDYNDSTRALNPLRRAEDAIEIDTTDMSIEETTSVILKHIKRDANRV
jgi:cytidylate kinase